MDKFEQAFGKPTKEIPLNVAWDKPCFDNTRINPSSKYVAWIDLMGAANHFLLSLAKSACFVGKVHDAGLKARNKFPSVTVHPISDGFFAISEDWDEIKQFVQFVMRSLAYVFAHEQNNDHKFIVRSSIAYGQIVTGEKIKEGCKFLEDKCEYFSNVFVGSPLAWAYKAESKAPPFGIYIDQSVTTHSTAHIGWILHKWWSNDQSKQKTLARDFGKSLIRYLDWLKLHSCGMRYPQEKHEQYIQLINEYYGLVEQHSEERSAKK